LKQQQKKKFEKLISKFVLTTNLILFLNKKMQILIF